ncbi:MAG: LD-carboxypeptidase [Bacteroidetes bacterium]|nr:LD-carboxypeptidase [Bacteroidota bacterium]
MKNIILPPPLQKGDAIAILSPAGSVEMSSLEQTIFLIEEQGYQPVLAPNTLGKHMDGYSYSGTEVQRTQDLNWALNSNEIKAIWASRGGYGCQHLIQHIELKNFKKNPKWYIGYSDNTVIQSFLLKKGFASVHGQTIKTSSFGVSQESYQGIFDVFDGKKLSYTIDNHPLNTLGEGQGALVGGNLALVYALLGTPYSFSFQDAILFLEDIGENYYALDRMLMSLELAGVFKKIKGLIIGGMTQMGNENENPMYEASFDEKAYEIIAYRVAQYDFPTIFGFPNGHIFDNRPLIIGGHVNIVVDSKVSVYF